MIAILGGGISGLAAACQLKKEGKEFVLIEANDKIGGKIQTKKHRGFTFELGPNTVLINNLETKQLLEQLGLLGQVINPEEKAVKNRFVLKNGEIEQIPNSLKTALKSKLFSFSTLLRLLSEPFKSKEVNGVEESLADFSRRRFGNQIYEDLITPFITGIYAGEPEKMSINHTMAILKEAEIKHGSVLKGMIKIMKEKKVTNEQYQLPKQKIFTFKSGLGYLIEQIEAYLGTNHIYKNAEVSAINQIDSSGYKIDYIEQGKTNCLKADKVISCLPSTTLSKLVKPLSNELSHKLNQIHYVSAVVVHLGFDRKNIHFAPPAFGILSRKKEKVPFLGVLFNARFFPHQAPVDKELLTVICGGYQRPDLIDESDEKILNEVKKSVSKILGIDGKYEFSSVHRWPKGIPQYEMGYGEVKNSIEDFIKSQQNFYLAGNFFGGISVSDCIANGTKIAKLASA